MFRLAEYSIRGGALVTLGMVVMHSDIDPLPMTLLVSGTIIAVLWQIYCFMLR